MNDPDRPQTHEAFQLRYALGNNKYRNEGVLKDFLDPDGRWPVSYKDPRWRCWSWMVGLHTLANPCVQNCMCVGNEQRGDDPNGRL